MNKILEEKIEQLEDSRLAMFIICCHVDKILTENIPSSKYDIFIQAGAALTDKRVCDLNDFDNLEDNISDRNQRYSEMTAMYWAGKNIQTPYVGISHYRRRYVLSDAELASYMDEGFDLITTLPCTIDDNVKVNYIAAYYATDWQLFMDIIDEFAPDYKALADEQFSLNTLHPCNMNIFTADLYKEYCEWIFPMLDAFHKRSLWKTDLYQRRDVGFIGERLSSLFVEKKKREGLKVIEVPFKDFRSNEWLPEHECDLSDFDTVINSCRKYYLKNDISKCRRLVAGSLNKGGVADSRIKNLALLFKTALDEQRVLPATIYEYLPDKWKIDLDTLMATYQGLGTIISVLAHNMSPEAVQMFREFINSTGFSKIAIESQCHNALIKDENIIKSILELV